MSLSRCADEYRVSVMASLAKKQYRSDAIADFYRRADGDLSATIEHFKKENVSHMTVRRAIKRLVETGSSQFKPITGRPKSETTTKATKMIDKDLQKNPKLSNRQLARMHNTSDATVRRIKKDLGYKSYKAQPAPKIVKDQGPRIVTGATRIYKKLVPSGGEKILVIDDETYVPIDPTQIPGDKYFSEKAGSPVSDDVRFKPKKKFYEKFLIWQAIDQNGNVSAPYIGKGTINADVYLKECLKKRLLPFIKQHHQVDQVLFWPDMARAHYGQSCVEWFGRNNIDFVTNNKNIPSFPDGRPIEKFWALCKAEYGRRTHPAKNLASFNRIWKTISDRVARERERVVRT